MQRFLSVSVAAAWVLVLLCGGAVRSNESCAETTTTITTTTTTTTAPGACTTKSSAPLSKTETYCTPPASEKLGQSESEVVSAAQLYGSWKVLAGYSRELLPVALCPNLTLHFDPDDSNTFTVSWSKAEPYENVIPQGEMTMKDARYLVDKDGYNELKVIKLDKFLVLRVRNPNFWRAFVLARASDAEGIFLGDFLEYIMNMNADFQDSDGPAWYICSGAFDTSPSSAGNN